MKDENGKVTFDQEEQTEVNRIVEERIARERSKYVDYEDLKEVDTILTEFGYQGTVAEKKAILKQQAEETRRQKELEELKTQAKNEGTSPELLQEMKELKKEINELKKEKQEKIEQMKQADEAKKAFDAQVNEFEATYPDVDLNKLNEDEEFLEFVKDSNPNLSLVKLYERYTKYVHNATDKAYAKIQSNLERSTSSGKQKSANNSFGLTAEQRATVDEWNKSNPRMKMTYEEFSKSLRR